MVSPNILFGAVSLPGPCRGLARPPLRPRPCLVMVGFCIGVANAYHVLHSPVLHSPDHTGSTTLPRPLLQPSPWELTQILWWRLCRPFSNSCEAILLVLGLVVVTGLPHRRSLRRVVCGVLLGLGLFVRITFPAFFLPVCLC